MYKTFSASLDELYEMLVFVRNQAETLGFEDSLISKIELAVEEALVNIINYGYPTSKGVIDIHCAPYQQSGMKITLRDKGIAYNPLTNAKIFDPDAPLHARSLGGYGIFFILKMMDEVDYHRENNSNILTLIKYKDNF